ncbi:SHOCT domain-containing protein [Glaciihabitans sp. GrIS 2.15]|uniref:SHOCT domain-containing protein n=1 Tax=Glaciihabitans sp. GrIS 2.15 TaxID=3071710 RepID=UPI002E0CE1DD|nr:putative membrane protein [Glaciihabitans sp. GrIS 2.15]
MWGYGYNMMGWGLLAGVIVVALVIVAVIGVLRLLPTRLNHSSISLPPVARAVQTPRQILDERYAKGDLTTEEYLERVKHLGSA